MADEIIIPSGYSLSKTILYNEYTKGIKRQEDSIHKCGVIMALLTKVRYEENIPVSYDQSFILLIPSARRYYMMYRLSVKRDKRPLSHRCGVIVVLLKRQGMKRIYITVTYD